MTTPVTVIATIQARAGQEQEAERLLTELLAPTHREAGCVKYTLSKRIDKPGTFYFVEQWEDSGTLQAHLQSTHIASAMARREAVFSLIDIATVQPIPATPASPKGILF